MASPVLEGLARHASTHAAACDLGRPLTDHVPLYKGPTTKSSPNIRWRRRKDWARQIRFPGLKPPTMIKRSEDLIIERNRQSPVGHGTGGVRRPKTFTLLSSGKTTGIFQLESSGMRDLLTGFKPDRFEDIIAIIALYRPRTMD